MLCVYQNPTSGDIRGFLGKGLNDIQEVALIAGVNMPKINKGLAYIYSMVYGEIWRETLDW